MGKQIYEGNHSSISSSLYQVAECYYNLSQYGKALNFSQQSLQMSKQIYEGNHSSISSSLYQIAECQNNLSQYEKALNLSLQSLEIIKQIYEGNHSSISSSLYQVAEFYINLSQYEKALDFSLQFLEMDKQIYKGNYSSIHCLFIKFQSVITIQVNMRRVRYLTVVFRNVEINLQRQPLRDLIVSLLNCRELQQFKLI
ncbi:hypothetical protein ABPG72_011501 [Tetrahymena utriculariae]